MEPECLQSKFRGALRGVAVGDALGAPFEGMSAVARGTIILDAMHATTSTRGIRGTP
jgi:ADP-ribosylglycohydrolase